MQRTRIYLVRHGEIAGSEVFRYNGQTEVPLTPRGLEQYATLAERLAHHRIARCYTSDLSRCVQGAEIICRRLGVSPLAKKELRELSFGEWEGLTWAELEEKFPEEWRARLQDSVNYRAPGGENLVDLRARVIPLMESIIAENCGQELLVVGHGGTNRAILLEALGAPLTSIFRMEQNFGCLNIIDYYPDGNAVVKLLNG